MSSLPDVLVITRLDIQRVMDPEAYLEAAHKAFRAAAMGRASSPEPMHVPMVRGGFHAKAASMSLGREYVAVKVNGNFPGNPTELGLPTVQGAIILADGSNGVVLAILDSIELTLRRTAAASALAAKLLARNEASILLVCGCGVQGRAHVHALREVLPLQHVLLWDRDREAAAALAKEVQGIAVENLQAASLSADVIACCTSARKPFLDAGMVKPGTFIAAVGADNPDKSEIAPTLMASSTIVTDDLEQCASMGDLHHAIEAGALKASDVHAELGCVLTGSKAGRQRSSQTIVFDSTGTGLQDVAAAAAIFERCSGTGMVQAVALAEACESRSGANLI